MWGSVDSIYILLYAYHDIKSIRYTRRQFMKKKMLSILLAGVMILSLSACGGKETKEETKDNSGSETQEEKKEETAELEDTVVIYSTHAEELLEEVGDAFTEETGVEVEFINLKGELADRVRSEKENPQADIMFGGDAATYMQLQSEGCFAVTTPSWAGEVDDAFKDADGYWYGTIKTPVLMFYNSDVLSAGDAPTDWSDLADEKYKDQIVTRDSLSSSMRSVITALIYSISEKESEDAAWDFLTKLDANTKNYYNSGSMMYEAIGKGEASISIAVMNDIITNRDENGMPFEIVDAASGAITLTDCIAALNKAPHPNAAAAFLEFAGSAKAQAMVANDFNRIPVLDSALPDCPEWMKTSYPAMDLDWNAISQNQLTWLEKWETDFIDGAKAVASDK